MPCPHVLLISAVARKAGDRLVLACNEVSSPAGLAYKVVPSMPTHPDPVALLPFRYSRADFIYHTSNFVPRHAWIHKPGPVPVFHQMVAETNSTGMHLDPHLAKTRLGNLALLYLKIRAWLRNNCCLHLRHHSSPGPRTHTRISRTETPRL